MHKPDPMLLNFSNLTGTGYDVDTPVGIQYNTQKCVQIFACLALICELSQCL